MKMLKLILQQMQNEIAVCLSSRKVSTDVDCFNKGESWQFQEFKATCFHLANLVFESLFRLFPLGLIEVWILTVCSEEVDRPGNKALSPIVVNLLQRLN
jgi:hypothetical protein